MKNLSNTYIAALFLATAAISACHSKKDEKASQQQEAKEQSSIEQPTVEPVVLQKGKLSSTMQVPGELQPFQEVSLYAKLNSFVKSYLVDVGSKVHKNQLLAVLEAPEINSQLAAAKSRIKQMEAVYLASKATYDRLYNTSKTPGTVAQNDLDQASARMKSDLANVEAAKASYQEVAANLAYLQIRAPFDGVVSVRNINAGAYVSAAGAGANTPLFVIQEQSKLRLVISVPELNTGGLSHKESVNFTVRALPNEEFTARIKRIAGALDTRLRSERLEMDVYNPTRKLLPGMYAEVNVPLQSPDSTFIIPKTALVQSTERVFVVKITPDHRAKWIDVQKGLQSKDVIEIYSKELNPGDRIVKIATDEIRDGQPVKDNGGEQGGNKAEAQGSAAQPQKQGNGKGSGSDKQGSQDAGEKNLGQEPSGEHGDQGGSQDQSGKKGKGAQGADKKKQFGNGGRVGG